MKITAYNNVAFTSNNKTQNYNMFLYTALQGVGAYIGYSIPLKEVDGPDNVSGMNGSRKLVIVKSKVPNIIGKWKNVLAVPLQIQVQLLFQISL